MSSGFGSFNSISLAETKTNISTKAKSESSACQNPFYSTSMTASTILTTNSQASIEKSNVQGANAVAANLKLYKQSRFASIDATSPEVQKNQPDSVTSGDFQALQAILKSLKGAGKRAEFYELAYFTGNFINRYGQAITPVEFTETNQDKDFSNLATVLMEALIDDIDEDIYLNSSFGAVPYWTQSDADGKTVDYYLSGKSIGRSASDLDNPSDATKLALGKADGKLPTFITYAYNRWSAKKTANLLVKRGELNIPAAGGAFNGCGMTQGKIDTINYLSRRSGALTGAEAGALLGAFGGAHIGVPVLLGKLSVGDNKTVHDLVQAVLAEAAARATLDSAQSFLLRIDYGNSPFSDIMDSLEIQTPTGSATTPTTSKTSNN
jgi:hypothetical protein